MKTFVMAALNMMLLLHPNILHAQDTKTGKNVEEAQREMDVRQLNELSDKLAACDAFTQEFKHPFTNQTMKRSIVGVVDGKCFYVEDMPGNGKMECSYSEESRKAVAQYYRLTANSGEVRTKAKASLSADGEFDSEATTTIDGKVVENLLQAAMNDGTCTISGY